MSIDEGTDLLQRLEASAERLETSVGSGLKMAWRRWGRGEPVVLLHGGAGSWMHWARNIEPLAERFDVWVPDLPGFGDSDVPEDAKDADTIAPHVLRGTLELMRMRPFQLVGFSFGALVAAYMAAEQPAMLKRLVLVSVNGMGILGQPPTLKGLRGITDPQEREAVLRFNLAAIMLDDPANASALAVASQGHGAARERIKNRKLVLSDVLLELAPRWRCPAHAIWGRGDVVYRHQIPRLEEAAAKLGLRDVVILDGAGHWAQYEGAQAFNSLLASWLEMA